MRRRALCDALQLEVINSHVQSMQVVKGVVRVGVR
jgi:hypothetical protein